MIIHSLWLSWLTPGYQMTILVDETGLTYQAEIEHFAGEVNPVSQSIKAYAILKEENHNLLSGMSGKAILEPPADFTQLPILP